MTDLSTKIADVRRKALEANAVRYFHESHWRLKMSAYGQASSPDLIIAWAEERDRDKARIEELEKELTRAREIANVLSSDGSR